MKLQTACFSVSPPNRLPKSGQPPQSCEDAVRFSIEKGRFCVSDGATEAFDSGRWARFLCITWIFASREIQSLESIAFWLKPVAERFSRYWARKTLPWYAEEKARSGAFATFLGLEFFDSGADIVWQAIAIGDSCLIQTRANQVVSSFPIEHSAAFNYHPVLFPSDTLRQVESLEHVKIKSGQALVGDSFYLLTDAIAAWFLAQVECNLGSLPDLERLLLPETPQAFSEFIDIERSAGRLRNDDVAIICFRIESQGSPGQNP